MEMSDISVIYRYLGDISSILGDFSLHFRLQKSCHEGPTPKISMIYRDISILTRKKVINVNSELAIHICVQNIYWPMKFK